MPLSTSYVQYNALGQPVEAFFPATANTPSETVTYEYGANGRLESVEDVRGTTELEYEDECYSLTNVGDRVASVDDPVTRLIIYTYTLSGSVASKTLPDNKTVSYAYGPQDYQQFWNGWSLPSDDPNSIRESLKTITDSDQRTVICAVNPDGSPRWVEFNQGFDENEDLTRFCRTDYYLHGSYQTSGTVNYYDNTARGWLGTLQNTIHVKDGENWPATTLAQNEYTYDNIGNRLTNAISDQTGPVRTETYTYDDLSRLETVDYGVGETNRYQTYTFDDMGNRLSLNTTTTYGYNAANMLTTINSQPYATYDYNGNQLAGGGRTNVWDSQNRLFSCTYDNVTSAFTYGADGLRRSMTVGNNLTVHYALDGQSVVQEGHLDQGDFVTDVTYLLGPRGIEYRKDTSGVSWYLYDGLGSVVAEVDEAGILTSTRKYDVYGGLRDSTGTGGDQKFCGSLGHSTEPDTGGLIYMRARWMDPVTGRFISEDPAGDGDNWFAYCANNPVNRVDSTGEFAEAALFAAETQYNAFATMTAFTALAGVAAIIYGQQVAQDVFVEMARGHDEDKWHHEQKRKAWDTFRKAMEDWIESGQEGPRPRPKYPQRWRPGKDVPPSEGEEGQ